MKKKKLYSLVRIHKKENPQDREQDALIFESLEESMGIKTDKTNKNLDEKLSEKPDEKPNEITDKLTDENPGEPTTDYPKAVPLPRSIVIAGHIASALGSAVCACLIIVMIGWIIVNLHPDIYRSTGEGAGLFGNILASITKKTSNMKGDVLNNYLSEADIIKKLYTIPEDATVAPAPDKSCYGTLTYDEADKLNEIIEQAKRYRLLETDEQVVFSPDADFRKDGVIEYYLDETIMVLCWKEWINQRPVNIVEVKIADGSQLRRKVTGDTYGSGIQSYCSKMSTQANAVLGLNADFYAFRNIGITCYNRTVYRFGDTPFGARRAYNCIDTLFIDTNGDFKYFERGTVSTKEEVQKWVDENDILYSIAFGPILIKDGEYYNTNYSYPIGEFADQYSRAGIGMVCEHHYLYMNVQNTPNSGYIPRATLQDFAEIMYSKNLKEAYNLDGGQTGEAYFNDHVFNYIDWGNERAISDIFYFATAIPEDERN